MGMGPIVWTCLALTVYQSRPPEYFINARAFAIPIKINPQRRNEVKEVVLLVSDDDGSNWQQYDRKPATEKETEKGFVFRAPRDGRYCFIIQQVDFAGRHVPEEPTRARPHQIDIVDTVPPQVQAAAERLPNGDVQVRWSVSEQYPDPRSLLLEYHIEANSAGQWTPLLPPSGSFALQGQYTFDPGNSGKTSAVRVRVRVKDQAQNGGEQEVVVPAMNGRAEGVSPLVPTEQGADAPRSPILQQGVNAPRSPSLEAEVPPFRVIPPARSDPPGQTSQLTSRAATVREQSSQPLPYGRGPDSELPIAASPMGQEPRRTGSVSPLLPSEQAANAPRSPGLSAQSPPVKIVRSREVRLDFTVANVGPSGLGNADVYVTLDKGATWNKMPGEVPISLPQGADLHGPEPVPGSVSVQLPKEAVLYGFLVAVKSKAGRGLPPPKPGDPPEVLVELDTTPPKGQLIRPLPDPSQPNTLLLAWEASDRNLADKPITLEWAERKDGPWELIGGGPLPQNGQTGQYAWRLPERLPPRVYLRLTIRDLAGNESRAVTDKPELIDLSVPQTKIIGISSPTAR